jgi:cytochrome c peroxidase
MIYRFAAALSFVILFISCQKETAPVTYQEKPVLPQTPYDYDNLALPIGSTPSSSLFTNINAGIITETIPGKPIVSITPWGATLGRVLFYDKKLSLNNTISCASCHHQDKAFTDGKAFSPGFEGRITPRSSMAIINPITQNNLFWDSRSKSVHDLSLQPVQNHIEMGMENLDRLVTKLKETEYYRPLFVKAFGDENITPERIAVSLSEFVSSITSNQSRFDVGLTNNFSNFNELEKLGMQLFHGEKAKCASCHGGGNFAAQDGPFDPYGGGGLDLSGSANDLRGATNIGLDLVYKDNGLGEGKFKIPTLRNIVLTAPYMHDGRFTTLDQVLNHYTQGIKPHKHLDVKFKDSHGNLRPLQLNTIEKKAIIAFLHTLTDTEMVKNPKWSNPFKQ